MRKQEHESWEMLVAAELAEVVEPDDFSFDDEWHELSCEKDPHRWELDPASAEDWSERHKAWAGGPALRWRHFGH